MTMAKTIKITDRMAEALTDTALTEDGQTVRLTSRVLAGTTCALMDRGLVQYDRELTRKNGYDVHTLTEHGMWVRRILGNIYLQRSFDLDGLDEKMVSILAGETQEEAPKVAPVKRPATKMTRLTAKMVDALGITIEINGKQCMIMSHPKTQAALCGRGLADEFGYLTVAGRYLAYLYANGSTLRTWDIEKLADEGVKWQTGRQKDAGEDPAVECECGARWPTGVMGDGHNDMNCTLASQRNKPTPEPTLDEYAQASRAIQAHIPNGRNVLRNGN